MIVTLDGELWREEELETNMYDDEFCAVRDDDNLSFIYNSLNAYGKFFPDLNVDIDDYINAGVLFFTKEHKPVFDSLLKLYFDNKEEIDRIWNVMKEYGSDKTDFNEYLLFDRKKGNYYYKKENKK